MCPLYPLHTILSYGLILVAVWLYTGPCTASGIERMLKVRLDLNTSLSLKEDQTKAITFFLEDLPAEAIGEIIQISEESHDGISHVGLSPEKVELAKDEPNAKYRLNVTGQFLGFSNIKFVLSSGDDQELMQTASVPVKVQRERNLMDKIFIYVVILLVLVAFVNMGCAINLDVIKENVRRPVALTIGLCSQYLVMPLVSYGLGYLLFRDRTELWLGLFLTGCSPAGGGSNMWTYLLGGSLDLSVTMTFFSTLFAFAMMPLWIYALGRSIVSSGDFGKLPYRNIATLVLSLVVPIVIGLLIRRWYPKGADFLKKMLKPVALLFIVIIMTFGIYAKLYLFSFFTWQVVLAGFLLPLSGLTFGSLFARLMGRKREDVIAIGVETSVQNTGLAIGVLKVALLAADPLGDIAIVMPVAVATMTPIPLFALFLVRKLRDRMMTSSREDLMKPSKLELGVESPAILDNK